MTLRAVPPFPAQLAADPDAPYLLVFDEGIEDLVLATSAVGLGIELSGTTARIAASGLAARRLGDELRERGCERLADALLRLIDPVTAWKLRTRELDLGRAHIMGIVNLTDDSFSGDGVGRSVDAAVRRAAELREAGATIIDVGAETARADRPALDETDEAALVRPVVAVLTREGHIVSSDTYKPGVATAALEAGAELINDISGLTLGAGAAEEAARAHAGYVLNYSYSVPKRRPDSPPVYTDVVAETVAWMGKRIGELNGLGLSSAQIALDPGIAFGKSHDEDLQVLRRIGELRTFGMPVLLAHSRKNFIGSVNGRPPAERDLETHITSALAYEQGARIFRVHDAVGARRALEIASAIVNAPAGAFAPGPQSWPWRDGSSATHMTDRESDKAAPPGQRW